MRREMYKTTKVPRLFCSREKKKNHLVIVAKTTDGDTAITTKKEITRAIRRMKHSGIDVSYEMHMNIKRC